MALRSGDERRLVNKVKEEVGASIDQHDADLPMMPSCFAKVSNANGDVGHRVRNDIWENCRSIWDYRSSR